MGLNILLSGFGARHRKRSGSQQSGTGGDGSGGAIAIGALLDGVPESMVLGVSVLAGGGQPADVRGGVHLQRPGGSVQHRRLETGRERCELRVRDLGRHRGGLRPGGPGRIPVAGRRRPPVTLAFVTALAAGAVLARITDTMIPEAFEDAALYSGQIAALGFLAAFSLHAAGE